MLKGGDDMKTAIVTGASRGIGRQIALSLAENRYNILVNYKDDIESAKRVKAEVLSLGVDCEIYRADVKSYTEVSDMINFALSKWGDIDLLVNNAGIQSIKLLTDFSVDEWKAIIDTHLTGAFNTCKGVIPVFVHKKAGKIINITSMWGEVGASCEVPYSAAKAGLIGFTKALAKELAPSNITVNAVSPGIIDTDMIKRFSDAEKAELISEIPLERLGSTEDISKAVLYLAESGSYITGQVLSVNGGFVI